MRHVRLQLAFKDLSAASVYAVGDSQFFMSTH